MAEQIYKYQPVDESGRPIGGAQVIKYNSPDELTEKLVEQNQLLIRKLRTETRKVRLGIVDNEEISDDAERIVTPVEFSPRVLTDEERYDLSRKLLDPTTAVDATSTLFEAAVGAPINQIGKVLHDVQRDNLRLRAKLEADAFVSDNPDYYRCSENLEAITSWMIRYNLAPVKANFQKAFDTLKAQNVLTQAPTEIVPEPIPVIVPEVVPVPEVQQPERIVKRIPTGLTREEASDTGTPPDPGSDIVYELVVGGQKKIYTGLAAVSAMSSEEYKRRLLSDPTFGKKVDKLEADLRKK
jgi:hypothetical protein